MQRRQPNNAMAPLLVGLAWLAKAFMPHDRPDVPGRRPRRRKLHKWQPLEKANSEWCIRVKRRQAMRAKRKRALKHRLHARKERA